MTDDIRIQSLAGTFSQAAYNHVRQQNGGDWLTLNIGGVQVEAAIIDGGAGIRELVNTYFIEALEKNYPHWVSLAIAIFQRCLAGSRLSPYGVEIWDSMIEDMCDSLYGGFNEN